MKPLKPFIGQVLKSHQTDLLYVIVSIDKTQLHFSVKYIENIQDQVSSKTCGMPIDKNAIYNFSSKYIMKFTPILSILENYV